MKFARCLLWIGLACLIAGCGQPKPNASGAAVSLVRTFAPNEVDRFAVKILVGRSGLASEKILDATLEQKVLRSSKNGADLAQRASTVKPLGASLAGYITKSDFGARLKVNDLNDITEFKPVGNSPALRMPSSSWDPNPLGYGVVLPPNKVRIGESWEYAFPKSTLFEAIGSVKATLIGSKSVRGIDCWNLRTRGKAKFSRGPAGSTSTDNQSGTLDVGGQFLLAKSNCCLVYCEETINEKFVLFGGQTVASNYRVEVVRQ